MPVAAQDFYDPLMPGEYELSTSAVSLYRSPTDTLRPLSTVYMPQKLQLIGRTGRWAVGSFGRKLFYVPARQVQRLPAALTLPREAGTGLVSYAGEVEVPGLSKAELYSRAENWYKQNFTSEKAVLRTQDQEAGLLLGRAWQQVPVAEVLMVTFVYQLWYDVRVEVQDGKFRYTVSAFEVDYVPKARIHRSYTVESVLAEHYPRAASAAQYKQFVKIHETAEAAVTSLHNAIRYGLR
ncbi:hypothetical protein GCM10028821_28140 [Hymenobacter jeollabukensis]